MSLLVRGDGSAHILLSDLTPGRYGFQPGVALSLFGPPRSHLGSVAATFSGGVGFVQETGEVTAGILDTPVYWTGVPFQADFFEGNQWAFRLLVTSNLDLFLEPNALLLSADFFMSMSSPDFEGRQLLPATSYEGVIGGGLITYTYVPRSSVPEPTTLLLLGLGLAGLGFSRKAALTAVQTNEQSPGIVRGFVFVE